MATETADHRDEAVEKTVGNILRTGVGLAAVIVVTGVAIYLARHGGSRPDYHSFQGEPEDLRTIPGIISRALRFSGRAIIQFGLLVLIATPVARVAFSVYAFARERDRAYVGITLFVLGLLLYSLLGGLHEHVSSP